MKKSIIGAMALLLGIGFTACSDANEYGDTNTQNPSWVKKYTDSLAISHPETLANTCWVRGSGLKYNAYGKEVQGYVDTLNFVTVDSVYVKMSQGVTEGTMGADDSNVKNGPLYEYTYAQPSGKFQILKRTVDDKGKVSKTAIFTGVAVSGELDVITVVHFGDTPIQTYLVKQ